MNERILSILEDGAQSGRSIREELARQGTVLSRQAFYLVMARLEGAGLVHGWDKPKVAERETINERWYTSTVPA